MKDKSDKFKWHKIDSHAAERLTILINTPGLIDPISKKYLPEKIKRMTGVSSYFATGYTAIQETSYVGGVAGEIVVARSDGDLTKNYNYVFAVSSGNVYFAGPYKVFGHHVASGQSIEVNSLFGQTPYENSSF